MEFTDLSDTPVTTMTVGLDYKLKVSCQSAYGTLFPKYSLI